MSYREIIISSESYSNSGAKRCGQHLIPEKCPKCGAEIENERQYNYTKTAGCRQNEYNKYGFSQTFYLDKTFFRSGLIKRALSLLNGIYY